ncbi:MAG: hypothetical protein NE328_05460 [Lentisphaeraceae bacterium]|nr:hypothetical protein [Lentisphaeraceae bacterium]
MKTNFYKAQLDEDLKERFLSKHRRSRYLLLILILICNYLAVQTSYITLIISFYAGWEFIQNEVDISLLKSIKIDKGLNSEVE